MHCFPETLQCVSLWGQEVYNLEVICKSISVETSNKVVTSMQKQQQKKYCQCCNSCGETDRLEIKHVSSRMWMLDCKEANCEQQKIYDSQSLP